LAASIIFKVVDETRPSSHRTVRVIFGKCMKINLYIESRVVQSLSISTS
jgi:hypothetical protein